MIKERRCRVVIGGDTIFRIRTWTVRQPMASKHFWCSSKAPWSAKTPINGGGDDDDDDEVSLLFCEFILLILMLSCLLYLYILYRVFVAL